MPRFAGAASSVVISQHNSEEFKWHENERILKETQRREDERIAEAIMRRQRTLPLQNEVKEFYETKNVQIFWASLIILNFFISAIDSQMLPEKNNAKVAISIFLASEYFFAYVFLFELIVNFYGRFFCEFWKSAWNIFDFLIVGISLLALYLESLPGISVLRLFRAFRVVRLFKRIKSMRKMMDSIISSLPGMAISFVALLLIMGIYAIIGVSFFREDYPDEFGDFLKSILSLFQIMTFDSWCSGIARSVIFKYGALPAIYFISYVFIASIVMSNVLITLLLDKFIQLETTAEDETEMEISHDLEEFSNVSAQRLGDLPEDRVLSTDSNSILDCDILEGVSTAQPGFVNDLAGTPSKNEHYSQQTKTGQRDMGDLFSGANLKNVHQGERIPKKKDESLELVFLENMKVSKKISSPSVYHLSDQWKAHVDCDIANLMQTLNKLNARLDGVNNRIDKLYDKLFEFSPTNNSDRKSPIKLKLSGVAI